MKRFLKGLIIGLALIVGMSLVPTAQAAYNHFTIYVYEDTGFSSTAGGYPQLTTDVWYHVLDAGTTTTETIYSDDAGTSMTNPVLKAVYDVDGKIDFYTGSADTTVDIWVTDLTTGSSKFLNGVSTSTRRCIINNNSLQNLVCVQYYSMSTTSSYGSGGDWDTEVDFPAYTMIKDAFIYVLASAGTGCDLDVGVDSDADGLLDDIEMDEISAGFYQADLVTEVSTADDVVHGMYGADLLENSSAEHGEGFFITSSNDYVNILRPHLITTAGSLNYTVQSSSPTGTGWIYVIFQLIKP